MAQKSKELKSTGYELFIGALSLLSILNLLLANWFVENQDLQNVFFLMNALLTAIFLGDFIYRYATAPSKREYFLHQYGWADLLASLPFPQVKLFRLFRLARVVRLFREVGFRRITGSLVGDRAGSALLSLLLMGILVIEFGSLAVLKYEQAAPNGNIKNASDAIWYVIVTISTVGYGDRYPTTNPGRLIGGMLILIGVGIFGTFTGYLANFFLSPRKAEEPAEQSVPELGDPQAKLEQLRQLMAQQQAALDEIERLIQAKAPQDNLGG